LQRLNLSKILYWENNKDKYIAIINGRLIEPWKRKYQTALVMIMLNDLEKIGYDIQKKTLMHIASLNILTYKLTRYTFAFSC